MVSSEISSSKNRFHVLVTFPKFKTLEKFELSQEFPTMDNLRGILFTKCSFSGILHFPFRLFTPFFIRIDQSVSGCVMRGNFGIIF